ncbi:hypothetical protein ACFLXB_09205 [Chloroflexota bacterium]
MPPKTKSRTPSAGKKTTATKKTYGRKEREDKVPAGSFRESTQTES